MPCAYDLSICQENEESYRKKTQIKKARDIEHLAASKKKSIQ
jgi:hypothetical protein